MTLAELLGAIFPDGHEVSADMGVVRGTASTASGQALVIGISEQTPVGVDEAVRLSSFLLESLPTTTGPILVIVDSDSQKMSKRDELLGLSEFLAHLAKCLIYADLHGRPTIGLLYGHSAAGAFLATALATRVLVGIHGASPAVMDIPSISKVTKLPIDILEEKAKTTPVFAPGLENLAQTGAIHHIWNADIPLADQLLALLSSLPKMGDDRDSIGRDRGGRLKAAEIAERVYALATAP